MLNKGAVACCVTLALLITVLPVIGQEDYESSTVGNLVYVPAGSFQRDAGAENISTVDAFYIAATAVTRSQFVEVMGADPSSDERSADSPDAPAQNVNWYHAIAFANKLSIAEGLGAVYSVDGIDDWENLAYDAIPVDRDDTWDAAQADWGAVGYRLPTEMEWMWAAMGATEDWLRDFDDNGVNRSGHSKPFAGFNGRNSIREYVVYQKNSGRGGIEHLSMLQEGSTSSVGSKNANELGLYDMSGNVHQWTWDRIVGSFDERGDGYPDGQLNNYRGSAIGEFRVIRGGNWEHIAEAAALSARRRANPDNQSNRIGFRVVRGF